MSTVPSVAEIRQNLEQQLSELLHRHAKIDAHLHNADRSLPADWSEYAQAVENDEVLEALDDHTRREVGLIRAALERMDKGSWGTCFACGQEIAPRRMAAVPWTTRCIECANSSS